jgi:flagellar hook-associated protein 3 FlgL
VSELLRGQERLEKARDRLSSGQQLQQPSDAPGEIAALLRARSEVAALTRRQGNIDANLPAMRATEAALGEITSALREARTLTLQARNATASEDQRATLAAQVGLIADRIRDLANSRVNDRYLFAGTRTDAEPFAAGPPVSYTGNDAALSLSLTASGALPMNVSGEALRNARGTTDLFGDLEALEAAVWAGDAGGMGAGLGALDEDLSHVVRLRADMGARLQYVDLAREQTADRLLGAQERRSRIQDADLASAALEYASAESAHEAILASAARLEQQSLLDYLR